MVIVYLFFLKLNNVERSSDQMKATTSGQIVSTNEETSYMESKPVEENKLTFNESKVLITNDCFVKNGGINDCRLYAEDLSKQKSSKLVSIFDYSGGQPAGNWGGLSLQGNIGSNIVYKETYYTKRTSDNQSVYKNVLGFIDYKTGKKTILENLTSDSDSKIEKEVGERGAIIQVILIKESKLIIYLISKPEGYYIKKYDFNSGKKSIVLATKSLYPDPNYYKAGDCKGICLIPAPVVMFQLGKDIVVFKPVVGGLGYSKKVDLNNNTLSDFNFVPNEINLGSSNGKRIAYTYKNTNGYEVLETVDADTLKRVVLYMVPSVKNVNRIKFGFVANIIFFQIDDEKKLYAWNGQLYECKLDPPINSSLNDPILQIFNTESANYRSYNNYSDNLLLITKYENNGEGEVTANYLSSLILNDQDKTVSLKDRFQLSSGNMENFFEIMLVE